MPRQILLHDPAERFVTGTVGMPGDRTFFLQARSGNLITSVALEKSQVATLADRLEGLISDVAQRLGLEVPEPGPADLDPLEVPLVEEFRVGAIAFGWDPATEQMLFELHGQSSEEDLDPTELDDEDEGPPVLRVRTTLMQAIDFIDRARRVVAAGRPPCPFCQQPLDPAGHICPRANGYRR
ncbi:MAG: DUF3090 family protein [Candidatus Nanopelagicales bacterium]|jgi:uncharacterized repeat protein (TIGR03847 family)|nr:DUF3090 family protein [Candidatus Nanopelagicales bacterium]